MRLRWPYFWNRWWALAAVCAAYTMAMVVLDSLGVFRAVQVRLMKAVATEHGSIMVLVLVAIIVLVVGLFPLWYGLYRIQRMSKQAEALTAATYLEAKRALERHRS